MSHRISSVSAEWLVAIYLVVLTGLIYGQTLGFSLLNYDDDRYLSSNLIVQKGLTWEGVHYAFTTGHATNWLPLTWLSHMAMSELFGLSYGPHHGLNVLLHMLNSLLVFAVFRRMTGAVGASAVVAFIFAAHPLAVESVAWVSERKGLLSTLFWLLAMLAYARYAARPQLTRYLFVMACFALGLLSKPTVITLPLALLLCDFWPLRRVQSGPPKAVLRRVGLLAAEKLPLMLMCIPSAIMTYLTQIRGATEVDTWERIELGARLSNAVMSYGAYLGKTIWPFGLAIHYPHRMGETPYWQLATVLVLLAVISIAAIRYARIRPYFAFGWFWYLGTLVPVLGVVQVGTHAMADRYMYVPILGLAVAAVWSARDLAQWKPALKPVLAPTAVTATVAFAVIAAVQTTHWKSSITIYQQALRVTTDNAKMHYSLGAALSGERRYSQALDEFERALQISPSNLKIRETAGSVAFLAGDIGKAVNYLGMVHCQSPNLTTSQLLALIAQNQHAPAVAAHAREVLACIHADHFYDSD